MINRKSLCDMVTDDLKDKIMSGVYKTGEQIPNEFDLASSYNVSRFTIREAIKRVSTTGIISVNRGKGTFVSSIRPASFMKSLLPILSLELDELELDENDLIEICQARLAIERETAYLCAIYADQRLTDELTELDSKMVMYTELHDDDSYRELDLLYHLKIAETSKNRILYEVLKTIQDLMKIEMKKGSVMPHASEKSLQSHKNLIEAFRTNNKEKAVREMECHINNALAYFEEEKSKGHLGS